MKFLFVGDSITKGSLGVSFVDMIAKDIKDARCINAGMDGDTISNITNRLFDQLKRHPDSDIVVLQGGYNDIFLPSFEHKGKLFKFAFTQQLKKALIPLQTARDFQTHLEKVIEKLTGIFNGKIILVTLGCINEHLSTQLNQQRAEYNTVFREIAEKYSIGLADAGKLVDQFLQTQANNDYFLENFWRVTLTDRILCAAGAADFLSRDRKLKLTIDGVHLNSKGARIFADCIMRALSAEGHTFQIKN